MILKAKKVRVFTNRKKNAAAETPSSVVPPLILRLCDITLCQPCDTVAQFMPSSVVVSVAASGMCELTNQRRLDIWDAVQTQERTGV